MKSTHTLITIAIAGSSIWFASGLAQTSLQNSTVKYSAQETAVGVSIQPGTHTYFQCSTNGPFKI